MNRFLTLSITGLIAIYFGVYSYVLNKELWHDEDTLYRQEVLNFNNLALAGGLAENLLSKKRYLQAEKYFQLAIDLYPRNAKNYINYSALLLETSRPYAALSCLKESKSLNMPHHARAQWYNNMGTAHFDLKKQMEALRYFMKAVKLWPNEPQFWGNLGAAYGSLGDYVNSVSALKRGLDMDPDSVQLRKNLAVAHRRMGDHAQAIKVLEKIPIARRRRIMEEYKD
jgi:tetratricopeptide (TPR) repeat protein